MVKNEFTSEQNKYTTRSIKISFFLNAKIKQLMHQSHETTQEDYKSFGKVSLAKKISIGKWLHNEKFLNMEKIGFLKMKKTSCSTLVKHIPLFNLWYKFFRNRLK